MINRTRNLLLFAVLAAGALGTWMLTREPAPEVAEHIEPAAPSLGFYLREAVLFQTDDEGRVQYRIEASYAQRPDDGSDDLYIDGMGLEYAAGAGVDWDVRAAQAVASDNLARLHMTGGVSFVHSPGEGRVVRVLETDEALLFADVFRVESDHTVRMYTDNSELTGTGLEIDLKTDTGHMTNVSVLHGLLLSLVGTTATAQDAAPSGIRALDCIAFDFDASADVCEGARYTFGTDSISADTAVYELTDTNGTVFRFTGNVKVRLAEAELTADASIFEIDSAGEVVRFEVTGSPVSLSGYNPEEDQRYHGVVDRVVVDNAGTTLLLVGQSTVTRQSTQGETATINGCGLTYNWISHRLRAEERPDCNNRLTIAPGQDDATADTEPGSQ